MPDKVMADAVAELQDSVRHIDKLAAEVKSLHEEQDDLRTSRRRWRVIVALLFVMVVAGGLFGWYMVDRLGDQRLTGCQNRNESARVTREFAEQQFAIFETATLSRTPTDRQLVLLGQLRAAVPQRTETELDCNGDDQLTAADYPPED